MRETIFDSISPMKSANAAPSVRSGGFSGSASGWNAGFAARFSSTHFFHAARTLSSFDVSRPHAGLFHFLPCEPG